MEVKATTKANRVVEFDSTSSKPLSLEPRVGLSTHTFYDAEMARYANELKVESPNLLIGYVQRPGVSMRVMGVDVKINSDGFRDDEHTTGKSDKRRIVVLGDSLIFGWGVEMEQSFEHRRWPRSPVRALYGLRVAPNWKSRPDYVIPKVLGRRSGGLQAAVYRAKGSKEEYFALEGQRYIC